MFKVKVGDKEFDISAKKNGLVFKDDSRIKVRKIDNYTYIIPDRDREYKLHVLSIDPETHTMVIKVNGIKHEVKVKDKYEILLDSLGMKIQSSSSLNELKAPMPGLIVQIEVKEGQEVSKGDKLLVLEAMKMENVIKSPGDGTISKILVKTGDSVEKKQVLIEF